MAARSNGKCSDQSFEIPLRVTHRVPTYQTRIDKRERVISPRSVLITGPRKQIACVSKYGRRNDNRKTKFTRASTRDNIRHRPKISRRTLVRATTFVPERERERDKERARAATSPFLMVYLINHRFYERAICTREKAVSALFIPCTFGKKRSSKLQRDTTKTAFEEALSRNEIKDSITRESGRVLARLLPICGFVKYAL